jgi:hypothetical protein
MTRFNVGDTVYFDYSEVKCRTGVPLLPCFSSGKGIVTRRHIIDYADGEKIYYVIKDENSLRKDTIKEEFCFSSREELEANSKPPLFDFVLTLPESIVNPEDLAPKGPECSEWNAYFGEWIRKCYSPYMNSDMELAEFKKITMKWIQSMSRVKSWMLDNGWIKKVTPEPPKNWDNLKPIKRDNRVEIEDTSSGKVLLVFERSGVVWLPPNAGGGHGNFDDSGRLIISRNSK